MNRLILIKIEIMGHFHVRFLDNTVYLNNELTIRLQLISQTIQDA